MYFPKKLSPSQENSNIINNQPTVFDFPCNEQRIPRISALIMPYIPSLMRKRTQQINALNMPMLVVNLISHLCFQVIHSWHANPTFPIYFGYLLIYLIWQSPLIINIGFHWTRILFDVGKIFLAMRGCKISNHTR